LIVFASLLKLLFSDPDNPRGGEIIFGTYFELYEYLFGMDFYFDK